MVEERRGWHSMGDIPPKAGFHCLQTTQWLMAFTGRRFLSGCIVGFPLAFLYLYLTNNIPLVQLQFSHPLHDRPVPFQPWAAVRMTDYQSDLDSDNIRGQRGQHASINGIVNDQKARELSRKVRVLVWVMTAPANLHTKAKAIRETWGRRPNIMLYVSSESNKDFPTVGLGVPEGRNHLTGKTMAAFRYIYENHINEADWFMKADDDTYVIVENLRFFLSDKNPHEPIFFGCLFRKKIKQGFYSGGSGYVISKEALRRFGQSAINSSKCEEDGGDEDVVFATCMEKLGVKTSTSEDQMGRSLFHPDQPSLFLLDRAPEWISHYKGTRVQTGLGVSKHSISFHYISPENMKLLDYFFYHIRPYGIGS